MDNVPYERVLPRRVRPGTHRCFVGLPQALELDSKYVKAWAKKGDIEFFMKEYHKALDSYKMVGLGSDLVVILFWRTEKRIPCFELCNRLPRSGLPLTTPERTTYSYVVCETQC